MHKPAFLISLLFVCCRLSAQTGAIEGVITGADDGSSLPGASVYLSSNVSLGTVTDLDGAYQLINLPAGPDTVVVSYVGFATRYLPVTIVAGETVEVDAELGGAAVMGEQVIVSAQMLGQAKAINQQLKSDAIANFVSADKIKELPDVNAAEAISRLPGVAINRSGGEGSKIVVRGLDPKFTAININGVRLPSTSGTDRSVDLSLISPELLSGIELFKNPTPDMDGDALGGTVNLNILRADDRPRASLKAIGGYNDIVEEFKDYKFTGSLSRRLFNSKLGVIATANVERFNRSGRIVGGSWDNNGTVIDEFLNLEDQWAGSLSFTHRQEIRRRYNASLGLDYAFGQNTDVTVLGIYSRTTRDQLTHNEVYRVDAFGGGPSITENSIDLYSGSVTTRHNLRWMNVEWGASYSQTVGQTPVNLGFSFVGGGGGDVDPAARQAENRRQPAQIYNFVSPDIGNIYLTGSEYEDTGNEESITTGFVDLKIPFNLGDTWRAEFKFGGKYRVNEKSRYYRQFYDKLYYLRPLREWEGLLPGEELQNAANWPASYLGAVNFQNDDVLSIENTDGRQVDLFFSFDEEILRRFDRLFRDRYPESFYNVNNNYDLTENVAAGYAMFKFMLGDQLTVIPGFRYEQNYNTLNGKYASLSGDWGQNGAIEDRTAEQEYGEFLPHLHVKYKPLEWFDIRASYSTTLARPDFNYIIPATLIDRSSDITIEKGNPMLGPSVSTNYDLFLTAFSGKFGLVSVGGFYKDIRDPFYRITTGVNNDSIAVANGLPPGQVTGARLSTYDSSPDGEVYGIEFDLQSNLKFLPGFLSGLIFNLNYARLWSNTTINSFRSETVCERPSPRPPPICKNNTFSLQREADLVGQANQILNASLGYDIGGFSARVSASYQGSKITGYSGRAFDDRYDREFWRMDVALKHRFSRRFNVFLNLNNLTNQQDVTYFRQVRFETNRSTFGTTATVGVEVKFLPKE